ncbi:hypothetical protein L1887_39401 [Cichorium endivia]|nr:hypothetical protein L1887_39401 [Cichorium endivia]
MAEANPNPLPNDGSDPPNQKNTTSATRKSKKGDVKEVNIYNLDIMQEILEYKNYKGVTPCDNPDDLREFCTPYINLDIGNARGWIQKMRELKTKFNNESDPIDDVEKDEFDLWKKIWGNDSGEGSSK